MIHNHDCIPIIYTYIYVPVFIIHLLIAKYINNLITEMDLPNKRPPNLRASRPLSI
jgi:hypothetical protein